MTINYRTTKNAQSVLRAINHKLRQCIIEIIEEKAKHGVTLTVTQLYILLRLEQSVCSQHLSILRKAGIVNTRRDGKCIYYSINEKRIELINRVSEELTK